ncbi:hypothetical protein MKK88_02515 [Methylobacterium sp. E-005]|uniref:hypothetical protein n=1 Tax=Methylobacterium sp. E-005 TaxID=2836549 RepID=UPI001FB946E5|nr:hypothetical protein [Methylobacterium sp. E-005]MCJ2084867.1 hypothetical protein [Methylobacterium sp. E-005]
MITVGPHSIVPFGEVQGLTMALAGAFAEGVDLGPRGAQIRALGESLATMIEALRPKLAGLGERLQIDEMELDLTQLSRMAEAARAYGISEADRG